MALEPMFLAFFRQTVLIAPYAGNAADGSPEYHTPVAYPARVAGATRRVMRTDGSEVDASQIVYLATNAEITPQDQITLPEGYTPRTPPILSVNRYPDETGVVHHTTVLV